MRRVQSIAAEPDKRNFRSFLSQASLELSE